MKRTKKESAVSPVVGVMLMLVVTIIIAGVIAAFAGGMANTTEKAPNAVFDVHIYTAANVGGTMSKTFAPDFTIDHISGDSLNTADLKLSFTWEHDGKTYKSSYTGPQGNADFSAFAYYNGGDAALYVNDQTLPSGKAGFRNVTISTGAHMQTGGNNLKQDYLPPYGTGTVIVHKGSVFMDELFDSDNKIKDTGDYTRLADGTGKSAETSDEGIMELLPKGTSVHVVITHTPSNKAIFDKEVMVQ